MKSGTSNLLKVSIKVGSVSPEGGEQENNGQSE